MCSRPRPWPNSVRRGPKSPSPKGSHPQFSAHICHSQMSGWVKMPLGMEVSLGPSNIVLDGEPAPPPPKGGTASNFRPMSIVAKRPHTTWYGGRPWPRQHCARWKTSSTSPKGGQSPTSPIFGRCLLCPNGWMYQDATWYGGRPRAKLHRVRLTRSTLPKKGQSLPIFGPYLLWSNGGMDQDAT